MRTTRKQFPVNWLTSGRLAFTIQRAKARRRQQIKKMAAQVEGRCGVDKLAFFNKKPAIETALNFYAKGSFTSNGRNRFHLLTPPRFGALNLPEVNQFTGNCFRMVRIVLKITFLGLRYPKGVTGSVPLCPIMALVLY